MKTDKRRADCFGLRTAEGHAAQAQANVSAGVEVLPLLFALHVGLHVLCPQLQLRAGARMQQLRHIL